MSLDEAIIERAKFWATNPAFDQSTRAEISKLLETKNSTELNDRFYRDLEFGTGGLRGILGAGSSRMNIYNVRKATTALCRYVLETHKGSAPPRIAISYDSRRFSQEFARTVAEVAAGHKVRALITRELRPVPMSSFMVRHFQCQAGVCVTASHNPPEYNGYKVYWNTGGQIVPPHDKAVINIFNSITDFGSIPSVPFAEGIAQKLITEVGAELDEAYFKNVEALSMNRDGRDGLKIVFTPLHGTAGYPVLEMFKRFGFRDVTVVPEQAMPDGAFPTVKSPNPEDPNALNMALELAKKTGADLVLGTDPDCDRVGIIVREGNQYTTLNGNQIGCLLNEYVLSSLKQSGRLPKSPLAVSTIVTTQMQKDIAESHGAHCDETLTGFKWICQLVEGYENGSRLPYRKFVCGGEESYGFLAGDFVRDKDGVISCVLAAEMVAVYKSRGLTLSQVLDGLYRKHGVYSETLYNLVMPGKKGAESIKAMMNGLRSAPPSSIASVPVKQLRDIQTLTEYEQFTGSYRPVGSINLPKSDVLQFMLEDGSRVSVRPSGTEPKIKFYVSVKDARTQLSDKELADSKLRCARKAKEIEDVFTKMAQTFAS